MSDSRQVFSEFVDAVGGRKAAAEALSCSYVLVSHILNGVRGISKELAEKAELASHGAFPKERMLWGDRIEAAESICASTSAKAA